MLDGFPVTVGHPFWCNLGVHSSQPALPSGLPPHLAGYMFVDDGVCIAPHTLQHVVDASARVW